MKMKDIALMLCNLPEGEYEVETEIGTIKVFNQKIRKHSESHILIDNKYYACFDYYFADIQEEIYHKYMGNEYILRHNFLSEDSNSIQVTDKFDDDFKITKSQVTNLDSKTTYSLDENSNMYNNNTTENMIVTYNLLNKEKTLYIKKGNVKNTELNLNEDYISIKYDNPKNIIEKYNYLIDFITDKAVNYVNNSKEFEQYRESLLNLLSLTTPARIDLEKVKKLDDEIIKVGKLYSDYVPKLNRYHSEEMIKTLEYVATTLNDRYNKQKKVTEQKKKSKKLFDISKFKNK